MNGGNVEEINNILTILNSSIGSAIVGAILTFIITWWSMKKQFKQQKEINDDMKLDEEKKETKALINYLNIIRDEMEYNINFLNEKKSNHGDFIPVYEGLLKVDKFKKYEDKFDAKLNYKLMKKLYEFYDVMDNLYSNKKSKSYNTIMKEVNNMKVIIEEVDNEIESLDTKLKV